MIRLLLFAIVFVLTTSVQAEDSTEYDVSLFAFDDHSIPWKSRSVKREPAMQGAFSFTAR